MKKAIKINLGGVIFHIDEDAYERLSSYLKSVELYFSKKDGGNEIVDDIEARMAELFQAKVSEKKKEAITLEDVEEVTSIMGDPSEFVEEAEEIAGESEGGAKKARRTTRTSKRLYRDPDNSVLGGVCGGLGAYFGIDPVILRILFVILFILGRGVWGIVYIVLWIAIPKAISIAQKLEMRGEKVTISNIEKGVKQEYEDVKANWKNIEKSEGYKRTRSSVEEIFQVIGRIFLVVARIVLILVGVALVFAGFVVLMSFLGVFFFQSTIFSIGWFSGSFFPLSQFLSAFVEPVNLTVFLVALFFAVIIPLVSIIYGGIKLVFNLKAKDGGLGVVALVIWVASISVMLSLGFIESRKYAFGGVYQENVVLT
ncbi:MAG: PspC domain-containing protein, partial [Marinilabiliales bacterium]